MTIFKYFFLCLREESNIHCVSRTYCLALMLYKTSKCQERPLHKLQKKIPANVLLALNGCAEFMFANLCPLLVNRTGKHFVLNASSGSRTPECLCLLQDWAACNFGCCFSSSFSLTFLPAYLCPSLAPSARLASGCSF